MKVSFTVLAAAACAVLGFCIAAAITAQASDTWWEIKHNTNKTNKHYYFGLYRACVLAVKESCYKLDNKGVAEFVKNETKPVSGVQPVVIAENRQSQDVWILSFFAILFTGAAFLVSVPTACLSINNHIHKIVPRILCVFTAIGTILGITSVIYAYNQRANIWASGLAALKSNGLATGDVMFQGRGFLFQVLYVSIEALAFIIYAVLVMAHKNSPKDV